jgi:site-specific DNA recombinase
MSTSARESVPSPVSGVERTCQWCGSVIEDKRSHAIYCSPPCRRRAWAARHGTPVIAGGSGACLGCGELLTGRRSDAKWCSERCRMRARREVEGP